MLVLLLLAGIGAPAFGQPPPAPPSWEVGSATSADGIPIRYQVSGKGPVSVVFVHGWACDRSYWREQLDHFARQYRVVALDLAGHGESGVERRQWTIEAFGRDVVTVMEALNLRRVVLVGHSMGGPVAVETARVAPEIVLGLVGVDTFHDPEAPGMTGEAIQRSVQRFQDDFATAMRNLVSAHVYTRLRSRAQSMDCGGHGLIAAASRHRRAAQHTGLAWPAAQRSA